MREDIKALLEKTGNINAKAEAEDRSLNEDEDKFLNDCLDKIDTLKRDIATAERLQETSARLAEPTTTVVKPEPSTGKETRELIKIKDTVDTFSSYRFFRRNTETGV